MAAAQREITNGDLVRVLLRSLLIQASWNLDRMQAFGFCYALLPVLRKLYPDESDLAPRLRLHTEYFNTQPAFASFILGAVARREEERAAGRTTDADISGLKASLMGPLAALGDSYFWGALRPLAGCAAAAVFVAGAWWAPLVFLLVYNIGHVAVRTGLLFLGYATRGDAELLIARYHFTKTVRSFKAVSLALLGGLVGSLAVARPEFRMPASVPGALAVGAGVVMTLLLVAVFRSGWSPVKLLAALAVLCGVLAFIGVVS